MKTLRKCRCIGKALWCTFLFGIYSSPMWYMLYYFGLGPILDLKSIIIANTANKMFAGDQDDSFLGQRSNWFDENATEENTTPKIPTVSYDIWACGCTKQVPVMFASSEILASFLNSKASTRRKKNRTIKWPAWPESFCSDEATIAGPGQKVVSFSLYQDLKRNKLEVKLDPKVYFDMAWINLNRIREFYPGWVMRLYTNLQTPHNDLCALSCDNADFFLCDMNNIPEHGGYLKGMMYMTWRDLPLGDPTVDVFVVRDLDSFISYREAQAVEDWLRNTDKPIHIMRDKKTSHNFNILGGLWGASNVGLGWNRSMELQTELIDISDKNPMKIPKAWGNSYDQHVLNNVIYEYEQDLIVAHDSFSCVERMNQTLVRPFPTRRLGGWDVVGISFAYNYPLKMCPSECRYDQRWVYC